MRRAVLRMRGSTAGTDSRRLSRSVALSAKDLITGASYNVRASRLARRNSRGASARRLSRGRHCDRHAAPRRAPALSPLGFATGTREGARKLCLWSPARRTNPGIEPRARGPATGDPRLRHDVQICCKGARAPHALPTEPRNHAVSSRPPGPRNGLCNRFGQPTAALDHPQPDSTRPTTPNEPERARSRGPGSRGECATSPLRPPPRPRGGAGPPADPRGAPAARAKITDE